MEVPGTRLADVPTSPGTEGGTEFSVGLFEGWSIRLEVPDVVDICVLLVENPERWVWLEGAGISLDIDACGVPLGVLVLVTIEVG